MSEIGADEALELLLDGNERFASGKMEHPNSSPEHRKSLLAGQDPFAVVVACSDSRVPVELIFDRGIGDIFVIRIAGNIIDDTEMGSIEYAVAHLGVKLVMVLGHSCCGAVNATVAGGDACGCIGKLTEHIQPSVDAARCCDGDVAENAIKGNVERMVKRLQESKPIMAEAVRSAGLMIAGSVYDLETGKVGVL